MTQALPPPVQAPPVRDQQELRRAAAELLRALAALLYNARLHDTRNDVFALPLERLRRALAEAMAGEGRLRLECVGSELFANGARLRPQPPDVRAFRAFEEAAARLGVGGLRFSAPLLEPQLERLLARLVAAPAGAGPEHLAADLAEAGVEGVEPLPRREIEGRASDRRTRALRAYQEAIELIRGYMTRSSSPAQMNAKRAKRLVHRLVDMSLEEGGGFSLAGLASLRSHDEYTFNHMANVCVLAISFGTRLGLGRSQAAQLGLAALYHDMGKLHVPLDVLNKRGPLSDTEWAVMGNHTVYAARTLFPQLAASADALPRVVTALQHHLRHDGRGYPKLRLLHRQRLFTRITAIVDAFDAMTTLRVYQGARLPHEALAELQAGAGTRWDPGLVRAFVTFMGIFPVGSAVVLRSGELAVVCEASADPERAHQPKVRVVSAGGARLPEGILVDLAQPGMEGRQIAGAVDAEAVDLNCARYAL